MKKCSIKYLLAVAILALVPCARGATINVSSADLVEGLLPLDTIVANAMEGDEIVIADGTYNWNVNVELSKGVIIRGASSDPTKVVLSRTDTWKVIKINHANAIVKDLTIKAASGGNSNPLVMFPGNGGVLRNCIVEGGNAYTSGNAGGITMKGAGLVVGCILRGQVYRGGGTQGVALYMSHKDAVVRNCLIKGVNWAASWVGSEVDVKGSVYMTAGILENCTIAGNETPRYSGIYATGGTIRNCLIGGNAGKCLDGSNIQVYNDGNATFEYCVVPEPVAGSNIHVVEEPFADADFRPAAIASIINAGLNQEWMAEETDVEGNDRILNITVDIGAYEISEMPAMNPSGFIQIQGSDRGFPPFDVTFTAFLENCGDPSAVHYEWNFGDGTTDSGTGKATVTHCFTSIGEHQVSLTVSNADAGVNNYALEKTVPVYVGSKTIYVAPEGSANVVSKWPYMTPKTAATNLHMTIDWAFDRCEVIMLKGTHFVNRNETIQLINGVVIRGETGKPEDVIYSYKEKKGWGNKFFEIINQGAVIRDMTLDVAPETAMTGSTYGRIAQLSAGMITNCVLRNGVATAERVGGGAVYLTDSGIVSHCVISNCVTGIFENRDEKGHRGSAVVMTGGRLEECLITGNSTSSDVPSWSVAKTDRGAPVAIKGGEIVNCTIVNNSAYSCAGVYAMGAGGKVVNTLIAKNVSEYTGEDAIATAAVWAGASANVFTHCFSDTLKINDECPDAGDPLFRDAANGDWRLASGSPCVNAGTAEGVTLSAIDLAGNPRVQRKIPDIGCYENQSQQGFNIIMR